MHAQLEGLGIRLHSTDSNDFISTSIEYVDQLEDGSTRESTYIQGNQANRELIALERLLLTL